MLNTFMYGALDPRQTPSANAHNDALLRRDTLGIEVTMPTLAARCGLGNIDPQHGSAMDIPAPSMARSAIEACLAITPPKWGSTLVTIRTDADALGAMALLALRRNGFCAGEHMLQRINQIGAADRFAYGPWPGQRPLPDLNEACIEGDADENAVGTLAACCADRRLQIEQRISVMASWLISGCLPNTYRETVRANRIALAQSLHRGRTSVTSIHRHRLALVISDNAHALRLGYCLAPVVIAINHRADTEPPEGPRKVTIAQYAPGSIDMRAVRSALNALEPGWGGSPTIIGSPQGTATKLKTEQLLDTVCGILEQGNSGMFRQRAGM